MTTHTAPMSRAGTEAPRLRQFVGGAWVASTGDGWIDDRNPSDASDLVAYVPEGAPEDAGKGYDLILEVVRKYDSNDEVEKNITDAQDGQVEALLTYTDGTCADEHAPNEGSETPSR